MFDRAVQLVPRQIEVTEACQVAQLRWNAAGELIASEFQLLQMNEIAQLWGNAARQSVRVQR
jgi:hypothetical protein